jgi:hypothetical protein
MGKRSDTTLSSFEELATPEMESQANAFGAFNFQLDEPCAPRKAVEGPSGPHLFRMSQESAQAVDFYLSMSPPASPEEMRRPEPRTEPRAEAPAVAPLPSWTPRQVAEWMYARRFEKSIINQFFDNDISGVTLLDIQYDDLKELGITSFGLRHRLWTEIRALRATVAGSPPPADEDAGREPPARKCSSPESPDDEPSSPSRRRGRRGRRADDIISPAESVSIVAIEQLLPKPHKCSKGESCTKWQKQQRKLARIATEFPIELAQITEAKGSPTESGIMGGSSIIVPSLVASSDLLGPALPPIRLEESKLREIQHRDPQENVRQFIHFQRLNAAPETDPSTPPYEMFPKLSPVKAQPPHSHLRTLPKLAIPNAPPTGVLSPNHTAVPRRGGTPLTVIERNHMDNGIYRLGSPASDMDVPVTAIHLGPIERDVSSSVPPDMRYGGYDRQGSPSRPEPRPMPSFDRPSAQAFGSAKRSTSHAGVRRQQRLTMASVVEDGVTVIDDAPFAEEHHHAGWMKKRKTKLLRHEWQDNHFRLNGTCLAMHRDENAAVPIDTIDVDDYAVACSTMSSGKINAAFKRLAVGSKKKESDPAAFTFQLTPAADRKGTAASATGKTHHFAVKTATERIDWMRELLVAKALKQKDTTHSSFGS